MLHTSFLSNCLHSACTWDCFEMNGTSPLLINLMCTAIGSNQSCLSMASAGHAFDHWRLDCIGFAASDLKGHMATSQISGI